MKKGTRVIMTEDALEYYGEKWRGVIFEITHVARSKKDHPGYDNGVSPQGLYDLKRTDTGEELRYSLYDWELKISKNRLSPLP